MTAYLLLAPGFETVEALAAADILRRGGVSVTLTGVGTMTPTSAQAVTVTCDAPVEAVTLAPGDMVILPGGLPGVTNLEASPHALALARAAAASEELYLGAICAAPAMLARQGILTAGDDAVCYPGMEDALLDAAVRPHMDASVVADGHIITGRAPGSALDFALTLLEALKGEEAALAVADDLCLAP